MKTISIVTCQKLKSAGDDPYTVGEPTNLRLQLRTAPGSQRDGILVEKVTVEGAVRVFGTGRLKRCLALIEL